MRGRNGRQVVGIVGGLGPFSHIEFERRLLMEALGAGYVLEEQDFPEWIVTSVPQTPNRTRALRGDGRDPVPALASSLRFLEGPGRAGECFVGADFGVIVCNTAHAFLPRLRELSAFPILDLVEESVTSLAASNPGSRVGILGTTGTIESRLYHRPLAERGIYPFSLLDLEEGEALQEKLVMETLYGDRVPGGADGRGVKLGGDIESARRRLEQAARALVEGLQVEVLLLGCTEISIVIRAQKLWGARIVDPLTVLARAVIQRIYGEPGTGQPCPGDDA